LAYRKAGSASRTGNMRQILLGYAAKDDKEAIDDMQAQLMRALYRDGFM
jgi:hypothetical protein